MFAKEADPQAPRSPRIPLIPVGQANAQLIVNKANLAPGYAIREAGDISYHPTVLQDTHRLHKSLLVALAYHTEVDNELPVRFTLKYIMPDGKAHALTDAAGGMSVATKTLKTKGFLIPLEHVTIESFICTLQVNVGDKKGRRGGVLVRNAWAEYR